MTENADFDRCLAAARKRVAAFDKADGFADRSPGTIMAALEAGLRRPETCAAYDALVMLQDTVVIRRKDAT